MQPQRINQTYQSKNSRGQIAYGSQQPAANQPTANAKAAQEKMKFHFKKK